MTDSDVANLLRSDASIVLIEAPAGCGKTFQAASYAADVSTSISKGKILALTHTHAACSVIAEATNSVKKYVEIKTLDSFINQIATAYRILLELPEDVAMWARENGYEELAEKVALLLRSNPMICRHLALLYPIIICDEHQDSSKAQDEIVQQVNNKGARLRVFGDPMQIIPAGNGQDKIALEAKNRWDALKEKSAFGELSTPHRWKNTNLELGHWVLSSRKAIKEGRKVSLDDLPEGITILVAENAATMGTPYRLTTDDNNWKKIRGKTNERGGMLLLSGQSRTVASLRATFWRKFPIWEGHTRSYLEDFMEIISDDTSNLDSRVESFLKFLKEVTVGFTPSKYGKILVREIKSPTTKKLGGNIPPQMAIMAKLIKDSPCHVGFAKAADHLKNLVKTKSPGFDEIHIDYPRELGDLIKLKKFDDPVAGYAEITQRRSRAYPKPPHQSLSTIHKAKGLEAESVIVFACDASHFSDRKSKANLLYVALSRPTKNLTIVISRNNPTVYFE